MRGVSWGVVALTVLAAVCNPSAAQTQLDRPVDVLRPDFDFGVSAPNELTPGPMIPGPRGGVPSPIAPSKPPTNYTAPPVETIPDRETSFIDFTADDINTTLADGEPAVTNAEGNVTARFGDMLVKSDRVTADYRTNLAVFEGGVVFKVGPQEVTGDKIQVNMRTGEWSFLNAGTAINPQFAKGLLDAPIFAGGEKIEGIRRQELTASSSQATSCDLSEPHYELRSRSVSVYAGSRIVFRDVSVHVLDRKLFTLRRLVIPLRDVQRNPNLIPRVGQSVEEGVFVKAAYSLFGNRNQAMYVLLDAMSRKGIAQGLQYGYKLPVAAGLMQFYHLYDKNLSKDTLTGRFVHDQQLGTVKMNLTSNLRSHSYLYAPESRSYENQLTLTRDRGAATSRFVASQSTDTVFSRTSRLAGSLRHTQMFGASTRLDTNFDYTGYSDDSGTRARLQSNVLFARREERFDWGVTAQKLNDLSDEAFVGGGRFAGMEQLPEIAINTDTARLGGSLLGIPARMKFAYGKYNELPANTSLDRAYFEVNTPLRRYALGSAWDFGLGAGFRQYAYGDDTAQYSVDASAELARKLGRVSTFALNYRYQQPRGFTPFRFDYVGRYNIVNARLDVRETDACKLSILTGYNFQQKEFPWQDAVLRLSVQPSPSFLLYTATGYDINRSQWRTLINQARIRAGDFFKLDVGTRYDTIRKKMASIRGQFDTQIGPKTRIQALAGWNGFRSEFDYRSLMITRDLHCWEASLVYVDQSGFYTDKSIMLNFRIKAFPLFKNYGVGAFGQALDTSVGQVY